MPIAQSDWETDAYRWVADQVTCKSVRWRIASVHRSAASTLRRTINETGSTSGLESSVDFVSRHDIPLSVKVDLPDSLGIDRILSAYGALCQHDAPLVVVDAGSAVTVDWVNSDGEFCGGAILPGMRMQADSLARGTDALPEIDWQEWQYLPSAAGNTVDAIRLGVITNLTAAIDRLATIYASSRGVDEGQESNVRLVLTGGDAAAISPFVQYPHEVVPNLVCHGLLELTGS